MWSTRMRSRLPRRISSIRRSSTAGSSSGSSTFVVMRTSSGTLPPNASPTTISASPVP